MTIDYRSIFWDPDGGCKQIVKPWLLTFYSLQCFPSILFTPVALVRSLGALGFDIYFRCILTAVLD